MKHKYSHKRPLLFLGIFMEVLKSISVKQRKKDEVLKQMRNK